MKKLFLLNTLLCIIVCKLCQYPTAGCYQQQHGACSSEAMYNCGAGLNPVRGL